jgi:NAD(P)-dependent dehydrogenase (short-subunit alcohol dehydrogenase family)
VGGLLEGRRALVTGAAGGIGGAVVAAFRAHGATVVGVDLVGADDVRACDVTDEAAVAAAFADGPFDDVVSAAGIVTVGTVADTELETFRRVLDVNVVGSFLVAREAARQATAGATITVIASQAARKGAARWGTYCASKFALVGLTESLAQELAPRGARVNCVCPGGVDTALNTRAIEALAAQGTETADEIRDRYDRDVPFGRPATPGEVAGVCVFLASSLAGYVAGSSIVVDGGELS